MLPVISVNQDASLGQWAAPSRKARSRLHPLPPPQWRAGLFEAARNRNSFGTA